MPILRKTARVSVALVSLLLILYIGVWILIQTPQFRSWLEASARDAGIDLKVARLAPVLPFGLVVSAVEITVPAKFHFISKEIQANLNPFYLMLGQLKQLTLLQPTLRLKPTSSTEGGEAPAINLVLRSFAIKDGTVELETGNANTITIPRIELSGENLNLGSQSGQLATTAFVPELQGDVDLRLDVSPAVIKARFELVQHRRPGAAALPDTQPAPKSHGELSLRFEPDATVRLTAHATLEQVAINAMRYTGTFELSARTDSKYETVTIDLVSETTNLTGFAPTLDMTPALPFVASIAGHYTTTDGQLNLTRIHATSSLGTVNGRGALVIDETPRITNAILESRNVALSQAQRLVPGSQLGGLDGSFSAKLTLKGNVAPLSLSGIIETTATNVTRQSLRIGRLVGTLPFALSVSQFRASGLRLEAEKLDWNVPGRELDVGIAALGIKGELRYGSTTGPNFKGRLDFNGGRFATNDGLSAAESIGGNATVELLFEPDGLARTQLGLELHTMELLWNRFFGDFRTAKPSLNLSVDYQPRDQTVQVKGGKLSLNNIGDLEFNGRVQGISADPRFELRVRTPRLKLANLYEFFVRETFKTSLPLLGELQLAGTAVTETVVRGGPESFTLKGTVQLRKTEFVRPDHWSVGPVEFALPFKLDYPKQRSRAAPTEAPRAGIAIRNIKVGATEIPAFTAFVSLWNNAFTLLRPLQIPIYGGALMVEQLSWPDIVAAPTNFSFTAKIDDISLATLSKDQGWYEFDGSLSGVIPQVKWSDDAFRTNGQLELHIFDGNIKVDGLEVAKLSGSLPAIKANLTLRGIDLAQATKAFEFGSISGTLEGSIEDLVISGGQPSQFRANLTTTKDKGVSQWISVEALNEIAVLSSGTGGNALYGTLAGFFDFYRYRKLGFKAQLRNDLLLLQGIKSKGGQEFLVEGSVIPPTVNIVSHTQRIGFKELMKRLERIRQAAPTQAPSVQ